MWKIDTLDPRGGLAFASFRNVYLADEATEGAGRGCVFIGAPYFRPEPVANRSLALAAARGAFQIGFYIREGKEVSFRSATDVAEFVRRTFVRGGGGDEPGDGGPEINPPEIPLEPLGRLLPEGERGKPVLSNLFADGLKRFQTQIGKLKNGDSLETQWATERRGNSDKGKDLIQVARFPDGPELLAAGALRMIHEMLRRWPVSGDPMAVLRWQRSALRLGRLIDRVGVYPLLFSRYSHILDNLFRQVFGRLGPRFKAWQHLYDASARERMLPILLTLLFWLGVPLDVDEVRLWQVVRWRVHRNYDQLTLWNSDHVLSQNDPVSDLANLPCPHGFEKLLGRNTGELVSLYNLLTALLGSPPTSGGPDRGVLELMLFSGAAIVGQEGGASLYPGHGWGGKPISPSEMEALKLLAGETWSWLAEHLPQLAFSEEIEGAIQSTSGLRYTA